jgi:heme-degrading monooxygenase HmoA
MCQNPNSLASFEQEEQMPGPYTHGVWRVKPGHGDEFVAAWTDLAEWTLQNARGAGWGKLLRDMHDEHRFVSIGPWESLAAIEAWRALDGWKQRVGRIRDLLVSFEPSTLEAVVERGL